MSAQTLIIFDVFKLPKHTKTIKKISKYLNYPRDYVLCVFNAKCAKTKKKRTKFAILTVSVPQVSKLVKISPYAFILKGKVNPRF
jgi:predicted RNA-binding protein with PIN domain